MMACSVVTAAMGIYPNRGHTDTCRSDGVTPIIVMYIPHYYAQCPMVLVYGFNTTGMSYIVLFVYVPVCVNQY